VWRRRTHPVRSQRLASLALGVSAFGIVALAVAYFYPRKNLEQPTIAPLFVPLTQWFTILFVWFKMVREESREKREKLPPLS
jgi:peptidoglycan biosynthesis protein MviN/MurJ (putative lipid II flippase)